MELSISGDANVYLDQVKIYDVLVNEQMAVTANINAVNSGVQVDVWDYM